MHAHDHHQGTRAFAAVTLINLAFTVIEAGYGFATNSLALLSDALHNLGDVLGLGLAWGAAVLARRMPTDRHTYGWRRATLLSPLANAVLLVAFSGALAWEAIRRFNTPPEIPAWPVILVALLGIAVNLGSAWFVRDGHDHDLNRRGAFLHLHIWSLGAGEIAMTAHLVRPDAHDHDAFIDRVNLALDQRFGINHATLQIEHGTACEHDRHDRAPHGH